MKWTNVKDAEVRVNWATETHWVWEKVEKDILVKSPMVRTWIELPKGFKFIQGDTITDFKISKNPPDSPFHHWNQDVISLDSAKAIASGGLEFSDDNGKIADLTLEITLNFDKPALFYDEDSCKSQGVFLVKKVLDAKILFVGATCVDEGDAVDVYLFYSPDAEWVESDMPEKEYDGASYKRYHIRKPKNASKDTRRVGSFKLREKEGTKFAENVVFFTPPDGRFPISLNLGTGLTYLNYTEKLRNVNLTEVVLTGKAAIDIRFGPGLDMGFNGYTTIYPFDFVNASTPGLPVARFFGANGRVGIRLPNSTGTSDLRLLTGYYIWGMRVSDRSYGIRDLQGPQIFAMGRSFQQRHRSFYGYFKFAPIYESGGALDVSNREIALGTGYQINNPKEALTWSLTADVSDARFTSKTAGNSMKLFTVTIGVQFMI